MSNKSKPSPTTAAPEQETLPAVVVGSGESRWLTRYGDGPRQWPTNLDLSQPAHLAMLANAGNPPTITVAKDKPARMRIRYWVYCVCDAEDRETGEISQAPRTTLYGIDGATFSSRSQYLPGKLKAFSELFTVAQWERGIPVVIREHYSERSKRTSHVIDVDVSQEL